MKTIIINSDSTVVVTVQRDGAPMPVSGSVNASLVTELGVQLLPPRAVPSDASGANWPSGVVAVGFTSAETAALTAGPALLVLTGGFGVKRFSVLIEGQDQIVRSSLFVRDVAVDALRRDRLVLLANSIMPDMRISDDFLWDKLRAAESEIAHELRVPLAPTHFFPEQPTADQIAALGGKPWAIDPGYDYFPGDFQFTDKWGMIKTRNKPLHSVSRVRFAYPGGPTAYYDLPLDWLRMDKKYGVIQFVPSSTAFAAPLNAFVMQAIGNGRTIPLAIQVSYVAGLDNAALNYPELIDLVVKKAVVKIIEDAYLPQSGSISADGLSQSVSVNMDSYHDAIERIINGGKGSNGGLMAAIHGIRVGAL